MIPAGKYFIDRIEGARAVIIHHGNEFSLPFDILPPGAREGDFLELKITIDTASRAASADDVTALRERLRRDVEGDG